jgi:colanic acid/amylovoran biosynthesis glycosyltransferase
MADEKLYMRIAYFTNQYPAVSHTFIRREILALEGLGVTVVRYALRPAPGGLIHDEDRAELQKTGHILCAGAGEILRCVVVALARQPLATIKMTWLSMKMGWRSDRGLLRHFAYAVEATVLANWCKRDEVQHVHAHFGTNSAAIAMLAGQLSNIPYSFTAHGSEEFEKAPMLSLDLKLLRAAFAVCVSSFGRSQLMRWSSPGQWDKIALVHCGLDSNLLEADVPPLPSTPRFVCVGRLGEHKAQLILLDAVNRVRKKGVYCEVVMVGDGPMRPAVEEAICQEKLEKQITITGWVPSERVYAEIEAARALILPSFSENMPVVIMEAMALGRPVISTYIAGIPELVQPGNTGWLVPSGDHVALADAMHEALVAPISRLSEMGAAGRAHIVEHHDVTKEAKKLKDLFSRSIARGICQ